MSTEIQFANNNNESFADTMHSAIAGDECIEFEIESIIDGFYDYVDDINTPSNEHVRRIICALGLLFLYIIYRIYLLKEYIK